jgi:hypothetical protein
MRPNTTPPKARSEALLVERVGDELVVYDLERRDVHCLTPLAATVFELADGRTPVQRIAAAAAERLGRAVDSAAVAEALTQLAERHLVASAPPAGERRISRRALVRAGAAIAAAPLVLSIAAPSASAQASQFCVCTCRCCTPQIPPCPGNDQSCCVGRSCNCTIAESDGFKRCKPGNAGANICADAGISGGCGDGTTPLCL